MDHADSSHHTPNKRRRGAVPAAAADSFSGEVWRNFTDSFREVQSVLDRNRVLIQQVNENHQSKMHDNMVKNVELIQEINGNITRVKLRNFLHNLPLAMYLKLLLRSRMRADKQPLLLVGQGLNMYFVLCKISLKQSNEEIVGTLKRLKNRLRSIRKA
ncbi:hypothetical protein ACET3Z_028050 [Daucus carota]